MWSPQWPCDLHLTCVVDLSECVRYHVAFIHFNHYLTVVIDVKIWIEIAAWVVWMNGIACQRSTRRLTDKQVVNGALVILEHWQWNLLTPCKQLWPHIFWCKIYSNFVPSLEKMYLKNACWQWKKIGLNTDFLPCRINFRINTSVIYMEISLSWEAKSHPNSQKIPHLLYKFKINYHVLRRLPLDLSSYFFTLLCHS